MKYENLRPHQQLAVHLLRKEWKAKRTHIIYAPVGAGKTAIASYLTESFGTKGMRVLFIAPYCVLIGQTVEKFQEYGLPKPGVIWRDHPDYDPSNLIQIASADTLIRRQWPKDIDLVIVDECHLRRKKLLVSFAEANVPVIGLSGTPFAPWLGQHYESLIKPCSMRSLIDEGYLSDYEFYAPSTPSMKGVKQSVGAMGLDYQEAAVAAIMGDFKLVGHIVSFWIENGESRPTIAFCCTVDHANLVTLEFQQCGIAAEVMTAKTPHDERQMIFKRYDEGITKIICNVGVLTAGFDADVRCIIYARPTKSEIRWIQCLGRGLRIAEGKDKCLIFDHSGSVHRLGFPDHIEYDELPSDDDGMAEQKNERKEEEKAEKKPKECSNCHYMKEAGAYVCPKCGHKPLVGEDVETDTSRGLEKMTGSKPEPTLAEKQQIYSELKGYQRERMAKGKAISDGWVSHKYKAKFGVWPQGMKPMAKTPSPQLRQWITAQNIRYAKGRAKAKSQASTPEHAAKKIKEMRDMLQGVNS